MFISTDHKYMLDVLYTSNSLSNKDEYIFYYISANPLPITSRTTLIRSGEGMTSQPTPIRDESVNFCNVKKARWICHLRLITSWRAIFGGIPISLLKCFDVIMISQHRINYLKIIATEYHYDITYS